MYKYKKQKSILVFSLLILAGCSSPAVPTAVDPQVIYTAAAQTVQAQLNISRASTATAAALVASIPSATPQTQAPVLTTAIPPALSPVTNPSNTPSALQTLPVLSTVAPNGSPTPPGVPQLPATAAATVDTSGDKAEYIDQDPDDNTKIGENTGFNEVFKVKNVGSTTWTTTDYYVAQMNSTDALAEQSWFYIRKDVAPNGTASIITDMHTPQRSGTFESKWCLLNKANPLKCLAIFSVTIVVP